MAAFAVTTAADVVDAGDGVLSLREAVSQANATAAADSIRFAAPLEGRTLTLTGGQLAVDADVAIDGDRNDDGTRVTLDGNHNGRVLAIGGGAGTDVVLDDLVVTGGRVVGENGGGILLGADCGLTLTQCAVRDNDTNSNIFDFAQGGGIYAELGARLAIIGGTVSGNSASLGGGIALVAGSSLELTRSTVRGNSAESYHGGGGGAIYAGGSEVRVSASTLAGNHGYYSGGGAVLALGSFVQLTDSTIAGNTTGARIFDARGGGIRAVGGALDLMSCTVTGNKADGYTYNPGGGISVTNDTDLRIANSIVLGNSKIDDGVTSDSDLDGIVDGSNARNILGNYAPGAADDIVSFPTVVFAAIDPATGGGRLAFNGGPTPTVALLDDLDNPALGGGEPAVAGDVDQRGFARPAPSLSNPDVGAFELSQAAISRTPSFHNDVLTGTAAADTLSGGFGSDLLLGQAGNDRLDGNDSGDTLRGGPGNDALNGGAGQDTASYRDVGGPVAASLAAGVATGASGHDTLRSIENLEGGSGGDRLTGDGLANTLSGRQGEDGLFGLTGADRLHGGAGGDLLEPGFGNDLLDGGGGVDQVSYFNDGGPLAVTIDFARGVATRSGETDRLTGIENADGTNNADLVQGDALANVLGGAGGADRLFGRDGGDALRGALGNDRLVGGLGQDDQAGGAGADVFDFDRVCDSAPGTARDVIADFAPSSDRFDLSTIDARSATPVNDGFTFLAAEGAAFTGAGQVRWFQAGGETFVEANVDANRGADLQIELAGLRTLGAGDFVL